MLNLARDVRTRGHSLKLNKNHFKLNLSQFFSQRVVNLWNALQEQSQQQTSTHSRIDYPFLHREWENKCWKYDRNMPVTQNNATLSQLSRLEIAATHSHYTQTAHSPSAPHYIRLAIPNGNGSRFNIPNPSHTPPQNIMACNFYWEQQPANTIHTRRRK